MNEWKDKLEGLHQSLDVLDLSTVDLQTASDFERMTDKMAQFLNTLIIEDFNKLIAILYKIDVSRQKINAALENNEENLSAGHILTKLIIERETEKVKTRRKYKDFN